MECLVGHIDYQDVKLTHASSIYEVVCHEIGVVLISLGVKSKLMWFFSCRIGRWVHKRMIYQLSKVQCRDCKRSSALLAFMDCFLPASNPQKDSGLDKLLQFIFKKRLDTRREGLITVWASNAFSYQGLLC